MRRIFALALLAIAVTVSAAAENDQDGLVLGIVGKWRSADVSGGSKDIHFGSTLTDQNRVACVSSGSLTVWFKGIANPVPIACENPGVSVSIADVRRENSKGPVLEALSRIWQLVTPQIGHEPRA